MTTKHGKREQMALVALIIMAALLVLVFATPARAQTYYDAAVTAEAGHTYIRYSGSVDMSDDLDGTYHTQAFVIGESKTGNSFFRVVCDGGAAEDVDVNIQLQSYPGTWDTAFELVNAQGATATLDTLNIVGGAVPTGWHQAVEARIQLEADAANDATSCEWVATLPKEANANLRASTLRRNDQ